MCAEFQLEIGSEGFLDVLADEKLVQVLQVRQPFEKQNPRDKAFGMLHFVDRRLALGAPEPSQSPVVKHPGVKKILIDRRQFIGEDGVEVPDDLDVAFHAAFPVPPPRVPAAG